MVETVMPLMKSRRRIAFLKAQDHANNVPDYSRDLRPAKWGSGVSLHGNNPEPPMSPLWAKAVIQPCLSDVRFTPNSGHWD